MNRIQEFKNNNRWTYVVIALYFLVPLITFLPLIPMLNVLSICAWFVVAPLAMLIFFRVVLLRQVCGSGSDTPVRTVFWILPAVAIVVFIVYLVGFVSSSRSLHYLSAISAALMSPYFIALLALSVKLAMDLKHVKFPVSSMPQTRRIVKWHKIISGLFLILAIFSVIYGLAPLGDVVTSSLQYLLFFEFVAGASIVLLLSSLFVRIG